MPRISDAEKRRREAATIFEENGYCPVTELVTIGKAMKFRGDEQSALIDSVRAKVAEGEALTLEEIKAIEKAEQSMVGFYREATGIAKELMQYVMPKRKAVDVSLNSDEPIKLEFFEITGAADAPGSAT